MSSYFETEDFSNPIKEYVDSTIYDYVNVGYSKEKDIYLSYNDAQTQNSYIMPFGGYTLYEYLSFDSINSYFIVSDTTNYLATLRFYLTNKKESITRSSLGLLDIFGIAGGLSSLLAMIVGLFVNNYADKLYNYTIISSLYQVDISKISKSKTASNNTDEVIEFNKVSPNTINGSIYPLDHHLHDKINNLNEISFSKPSIEKSNYGTQTSDTAKLMRFDLLKNSFDSMKSRRIYNYSAHDFCYNLCVCFKCKPKKQGDRLTAYDRYQLYKQGSEKLGLEFDAIEYTKSQRKLKMLVDSLLDKRERALISFQYINTIHYDHESENEIELPSLIEKADKVQEYHESLNKFIESYTEEVLTRRDFRLINNVFRQTPITEETLNEMEVENDANPNKSNTSSQRTKSNLETFKNEAIDELNSKDHF